MSTQETAETCLRLLDMHPLGGSAASRHILTPAEMRKAVASGLVEFPDANGPARAKGPTPKYREMIDEWLSRPRGYGELARFARKRGVTPARFAASLHQYRLSQMRRAAAAA